MIGIIVTIMVILSVFYSFFTKSNMSYISISLMTSGTSAIELTLTLLGTMATWGGILKIAEDCGLCNKLSKLLQPILMWLFKGLKRDSKALKAIAMNITANIFGLGNAATPLGIEAMKRLEEEEKPNGFATRNMILLSVLNTSSIEIIPTTVIALRIANGSNSPTTIIPCVLAVSIISLAVCILSVYAFDKKK